MYDALQGVTVQTEFSLDAKKTFSTIIIMTSLKDKKVDTDILNGSITFTLNISSVAEPIAPPDNARDIREIFSPLEPTF